MFELRFDLTDFQNLRDAFVLDKGRGPVLYQRKGRRLRLMYVLKSAVPVPAKVEFFADFYESMQREMHASYAGAMMKAILTSK